MAHTIVDRIAAAFRANEVDRLVLLAEPKLLGELRQTLDKSIRDRVVLEIDSHLTQASPNELAQRLSDEGALGRVHEPSVRVNR